MASPEEALIFPPPGGPEILTVINRNYSNAVQQDVILRSDATTPGQNYLKVQIFGPQKAEDTGKDGLSESSLRASSISREIRSAFPGVAMSMSAEYLQNNYGAFPTPQAKVMAVTPAYTAGSRSALRKACARASKIWAASTSRCASANLASPPAIFWL